MVKDGPGHPEDSFWHSFFTFAELQHLFFIHVFMNNFGKHSRACFWPTLIMVSSSSPVPLLPSDAFYWHKTGQVRTSAAHILTCVLGLLQLVLEQAEFFMTVIILRCLHLLHRHVWLFLLAHVRTKAIITQLLSLQMNAND